MKALIGTLTAVVVGLTLTGPAPAAPIPDDERSPSRERATSPGERSTESETDSPRVVTGRVLRVNAQEGTIVIQTPIGVIALRGPKEDLRDVNVGDLVEVEMVDGIPPSASPRLEIDEE